MIQTLIVVVGFVFLVFAIIHDHASSGADEPHKLGQDELRKKLANGEISEEKLEQYRISLRPKGDRK